MNEHATPSRLLRGLLAGAAITAIGMFAIMRSARPATRTNVVTMQREATPIVIPVETPAPIAATRALEQRVRALETENAQQAALISNAGDYAIAAPFPDDLPEVHRAGTFRLAIEDSVRECMSGAMLAGLSCDEPPCIAMIGLGAPTDDPHPVFRCAAWQRSYGRSIGVGGFTTVECGDGRQEMVEIIASDLESWDGWQRLDEDAREHIQARHDVRVKTMLADHDCRTRAR